MKKCEICRKEPNPACDWQQGRCPYHKPMFNVSETSLRKYFIIFLVGYAALAIYFGSTVI